MTRVLIVDDKDDNLYLLRALLQGHGHTVVEAHHGAEALARARQDPPELVVSDLLMPVMDGYTLLRNWKSDARLHGIPFIVYTATYTDPRDEELALHLGADAFILKPAEPDVFISRMLEVLAKASGNAMSPQEPIADVQMQLKEYSEVLIRKLEDRTLRLEQANRELGLREQMLKSILDSEPECVQLLAADGTMDMINASGLAMLELGSPKEATGISIYPFVSAPQRGELAELVARVFRGESGKAQIELTGRRGGRRWLEVHAVPFRDPRGNIASLLAISRDVTERRRLEEERDRLFNLSLDPLCVAGFDGHLRQVNPAWTRTLGWSADELLSRPFLDFVHPDDVASTQQALAVLQTGKPVMGFENRYRSRDGSYRWMSWSSFPLSEARLIFAVARDTTERRQAEQMLRDSERRVRSVIDGLGPQMFVGLLRPDGVLVEVNRPALEAAGLAAADVIGEPIEETYWFSHSSEARQQLQSAIARAARGEASRYDLEIRIGADRFLVVDFSLRPLRDDAGRVVFLVPSASDITERKRAEAALRLSLESFEKVFRGAPEPMSISELESGRFIEINDAVTRVFGYTRDEMIGHTAFELNLWDDPAQREALVRDLRDGRPVHGVAGPRRMRSGEYRDTLMSAERIDFRGETCLLLMFTDYTERRQAELALELAHATLRRLSQRLLEVQETERAAIARELHDEIGQTLTAIKLGSQWLARRITGPEAVRLADCIALTDGALAQVRGMALELRPPQLDQLGLTAALRDLTERMGASAGLESHFITDAVEVAPGYLQATAAFRVAQEALTNVVRHAGARTVTVELRRQDGELVVVVSDDGCAFDPDAARRRAVRGGSVGLLGMEERVALAGGRFRIESHRGRGTRVEAGFAIDRVPEPSE